MSAISNWLANPVDNFSTTLSSGISSSDVTIPVNSVTGLPTEGIGVIFAKDSDGNVDVSTIEFVHWTGISSLNITLSDTGDRGLTGSASGAQAHGVGSYFEVWVSQQYYASARAGFVTEHNADGTHKALTDLALTTPKITTSINDANGNEVIKTPATADAVNEVTVTNAATGNAPSIAATGGDTNIDLKLIPKGSGALSVPAGAYEANVTDDDDIPNKKYVDDNAGSTDGWTASSDTWTYASASTFTIAGVDRTAIYTKGTRLKFTQTSVKYAVVVSSSFSTNTTVTIAVNTDYTIANAAITSPHYSYQINPQGYPDWFTFTPTLNDVTIGNGTNTGKYSIIGKQIRVRYKFTMGSTSSITGNPNYTLTNPVAPANTQPYEVGQTIGQDVGTAIYYGRTDSLSSNAMYLRSNAASPASWSSSVPFTWANTDFWAVSFDYQF
jgi:hypothetical protein